MRFHLPPAFTATAFTLLLVSACSPKGGEKTAGRADSTARVAAVPPVAPADWP